MDKLIAHILHHVPTGVARMLRNLRFPRSKSPSAFFSYVMGLQILILLFCSHVPTHANEAYTTAGGHTISPWLLSNSATSSTANGFFVILKEQADLRAARLHDRRDEKVRFVHETLRAKSKESQADLRTWLDEGGIRYKPYSIVNALLVYGDATLISLLAARPDVLRIEGNPTVRGIEPRPLIDAVSKQTSAGGHPKPEDGISFPSAVEWNVSKIRAPEVWSTFNTTGTGIVVAGNDTGVQWDHPALIRSYRGWNGSTATHDYNWHDAVQSEVTPDENPCGMRSPSPCDDYGHGTHTLGTMVGDDNVTNQIGVAPGAQWIACRNMESGYGTLATYLECLEFFLAPYPIGGNPDQGDPSKAPHIINNSWYCPQEEGCSYNDLLTAVNNLHAAGIMVVVSAGNIGPSCSTVRSPPAIYEASFSVGATNSDDDIAAFSSRGPVTVDGSNRLKPNISAPGVGIRSSILAGTYGSMSGTSMAAPHVAGAVALLWSAAPDLVGDVDGTGIILEQTSFPRTTSQTCGGIPGDQVPNNTYGWGRLDIFAAVEAALQHPVIPSLHVAKEGPGKGVVRSYPTGIDCGATCDADFILGTALTVTAAADQDSVFSHWSGACTGTEDTCRFTITDDVTLTAVFLVLNVPEYKLKVSRKKMKRGDGSIVSEDGAITCTSEIKSCSALFSGGTLVTLYAHTSYPNSFLGWQPSDMCPGTGSCIFSLDSPKKVTGIFHGPSGLGVAIRSDKNGGGTVTGPMGFVCSDKCKAYYRKDEPITLIATPDGDSIFAGWAGCPSPSEGACSITMDKNYNVKAFFANKYTIF